MAFHILNPIPHTLIHVKSHQDSAKDTLELPFPAIMNVMADQQATRQQNLMTKPASMVQNLATAQLQINNICITRDSQKWLLYSAGKVPIQKFYSNKYGWTETTFNNIAWDVQKSALQSFPIADQTRILKFVHGWLPTASRSFNEGSSTSQRCKICHAPREDNFHLFHCTNNEMATIQEKIQQYIVKDMHDHGDSEFSNIIEIGIINAGYHSSWKPNLNDVSRKWKAAVRDQSRIGWDHMLLGRVSKTLIQAMDSHFESQNVSTCLYNGNWWAKRLIIAIWTTMLELWKTRNKIIYNYDSGMAEAQLREKLENRIRQCYRQQSLLTAQEQAQWFPITLEEWLQEEAK
jgi:hypothetical protein